MQVGARINGSNLRWIGYARSCAAHARAALIWEAMAENYTANPGEMERILRGEHSDPFHILGAHPVQSDGKTGVAVRAFLPQAASVSILKSASPTLPARMERIHSEGIFE